jgi:hypothetical protein
MSVQISCAKVILSSHFKENRQNAHKLLFLISSVSNIVLSTTNMRQLAAGYLHEVHKMNVL